MPGASLQFLAYDRPALTNGRYEFSVETTVAATGASQPKLPETSFTATRWVTVAGPQYALGAEDVVSVFPPNDSVGDDVAALPLPHVVLSQSSRPWERRADAAGSPWLALLLFTEAEAPEPRSIPIAARAIGTKSPPAPPQPPEGAPERIAVIDVGAGLLQKILPATADLPLLVHVRRGLDENGAAGPRIAVVVGNRLPPDGGRCVAHLVSVEGRYDANGFLFQGATGDDPVRLVTLKSWAFAAQGGADFVGLLEGVSRDVATLALPPPAGDDEAATAYAGAGYVPLPHRLSDAQSTVSFYHGPLATAPSAASLPLPTDTSSALEFYDPATGMLDVSYAAAWTLGRLLALQDEQFSTQLYAYKRAFAQGRLTRRQSARARHLPLRGESKRRMARAAVDPKVPEAVQAWLDDKALFSGVPFAYLVPDERMLPPESLRFFTVDDLWVRCLLHGAFSVGQVGDAAPDVPPPAYTRVTGFLLRSEVVSGYPELALDATGTAEDGRTPRTLVQRRLSDGVLLLLFSGQLGSVAIRRQAGALPFGVVRSGGGLVRPRRSADGSPTTQRVAVPFRGDAADRVIDVAALAAALGAQDPAAFAFQMIEAAGGVRIAVPPGTG